MKISEILNSWYKKNARDLPWRDTQDPYFIWISEIILQQTQVKQGLGYYLRFIKNFPDILTLSRASEEEVLKLWQGLGYYSRARNLLAASKQVVSEYNGHLPRQFRELKKLKGIGDYTAAAIASIAFNEPVAAIDGNVSRVISRIFEIDVPVDSAEGKKRIKAAAAEILDKREPGHSNQALMEFGALQCRPVNPDCLNCPLDILCKSYSGGTVDKIPVKSNRQKVKERWFYYFIITWNDNIFIKKREADDIWKSLFQFPMVESVERLPDHKIFEEFLNTANLETEGIILNRASDPVIHQLTHQRINARFFEICLQGNKLSFPDDWIMVTWTQLEAYPVPRLIEKYLQEMERD